MSESMSDVTFQAYIEHYDGELPVSHQNYLVGLSIADVTWLCAQFAVACETEFNSTDKTVPVEFVKAKSTPTDLFPYEMRWSRIYTMSFQNDSSGQWLRLRRDLPDGMTLWDETEYEFHFDHN